MIRSIALLIVMFLTVFSPLEARADASLAVELVASGLSSPSFLTSPPGDSTRLFVTEVNTGRVRIIKNGVLLPTPFATIVGISTGAERGLLGMAFHPDYAQNGYFYLSYTRSDGSSVVRRYDTSTNPDIADTTNGLDITSFIGPQSIHISGWIGFDPDGYFYIAKGDAGSFLTAQNDSSRHGKILRLDLGDGGQVLIPPDNPYANEWGPKNQQWAKGLRNPWRCSFDRLTGDFYLGDVGNSTYEEIDYEPATSPGGRNYGWPFFEGYTVWNCPGPCDSSGLTRPVHVYEHGGFPFRCAVIGGYVYRGGAIPGLAGYYFFADLCSGNIWSMRNIGPDQFEILDRTAELQPGGALDMDGIQSFGEDARGELYVLNADGEIYRIIADPTAVPGAVGGRLVLDLGPATPNPSAGEFAVRALLPQAGDARARVFDASGRLVRTLDRGALAAGSHAFRWNGLDDGGRAVAEGTYVLRIESGGASAARKLTVVR
ncbi:MAG: PQQ-dependent sugar dehydrogenase [bacterium]